MPGIIEELDREIAISALIQTGTAVENLGTVLSGPGQIEDPERQAVLELPLVTIARGLREVHNRLLAQIAAGSLTMGDLGRSVGEAVRDTRDALNKVLAAGHDRDLFAGPMGEALRGGLEVAVREVTRIADNAGASIDALAGKGA